MKNHLDAKQKREIGEAIGEASMCWKPIPSGVFDSNRASEIIDRIYKIVNAGAEQLKEDEEDLSLRQDYPDADGSMNYGD